jgi:hypothetical protein
MTLSFQQFDRLHHSHYPCLGKWLRLSSPWAPNPAGYAWLADPMGSTPQTGKGRSSSNKTKSGGRIYRMDKTAPQALLQHLHRNPTQRVRTTTATSTMPELRGRALLLTISLLTSLGFMLIGYDNGLMGGLVGAPSFNKTFDHPSADMIGTIVAIFESEW